MIPYRLSVEEALDINRLKNEMRPNKETKVMLFRESLVFIFCIHLEIVTGLVKPGGISFLWQKSQSFEKKIKIIQSLQI